MTVHDAWASSANTASPTGDLRMDEATAHQLADELTTLASSMFGLLQPQPGGNPAANGSATEARSPSPDSPSIQDPASVVSVAIPVEPVVVVAVPESWAPDEADVEVEAEAEADVEPTEDEPAALEVPALEVPSLAVPSLAIPEAPAVVDLPRLSLVEPLEVDGLDKLDHRESGLDHRESGLDHRESGLDLRESESDHRESGLDQRGPEPEQREPGQRPSLALLNEIAFLDD